MENCEYHTLHHCEYGYVVQCRNCESYQVAFGNVILSLLPVEYKALRDYLRLQLIKRIKGDEPYTKKIQVPTDSCRVAMVFSAKEVEQLYDILQQAQLMNQVYETLNNNN